MAANISLKHFLDKSKAGSTIQPIYFRITYERKKAELHTGFEVLPQEWQQSGERTKSNTTIKKKLLDQKSKVYDLMGDLQRDNKTLTASILKEKWPGNGAIPFVANQNLGSPMRRTHYS